MISPLASAVFAPLGAFILARIVPAGTEVVQGIGNGVAMPSGAYVLMTEVLQARLSTNRHTYVDPGTPLGGTQSVEASMQLDVQLDFYGPLAASWAANAVILLRDEIACDDLAPDVAPLYADDALQAPLTTAEETYLDRWIVRASMQYNPGTTVAQQFADALAVELVEVDTRYPPN